MDTITIADLEVHYQVGVTDEERATPQRLLITLGMTHDFSAATARDNLAETIDYYAVSQRLLRFGDGCHWELIETLAAEIATMILDEFKPQAVSVVVKKFVMPKAAYVSVALTRARK